MLIEVNELPKIEDNRGWLVEILKNNSPDTIGQIHFSISKQGTVRGNHYHEHRIEWLLVTKGAGTVFLEDNTTKEKRRLSVSGDNPVLVKIYPNTTHAIVNFEEQEMHLLIIANEKHDQKNPDTYRNLIYSP